MIRSRLKIYAKVIVQCVCMGLFFTLNTYTYAQDMHINDSIPDQKNLTQQDSLQFIADSIEFSNQNKLKELSTPIKIDNQDSITKIPTKRWIPNSTKATWMAVIFPGGGQIYNRKFWKLPIIYGGFAGCAYALTWNNKMFKDYSNAYLDIMDNDPKTNSHLDLLPNRTSNYSEDQLKETIRKRKDMFRRYRDLSIIATIAVYAISIIDAYVDAELSDFDITPDLSMRIEPVVIDDNNKLYKSNYKKSVGLQCSFKF